MKLLLTNLLLISSLSYGQMSTNVAKDSAVRKYHISSYSYHEQFIEHNGYGAPLIFTADGGAAVFGNGDLGVMLVKLNKTGKEEWKQTISMKGDEMEAQSVVQDINGNYYLFILVHDRSKYRGGCERVIYMSKDGKVMWDKFIGSCSLLNNPTVSYILALKDGRIALRGHVVKETPPEGKDPKYRYWEGWLNSTGKLTQKSGAIIDWANQDWKKLYKPE